MTGLVLAAGSSRRLGSPKQLLPYRETTLLDATLRVARECGFDQLLITLGAWASDIRSRVDLSGAEVIENPAFAKGCSSSISGAIRAADPRSDGVVLLLGEQPTVAAEAVRALIDGAAGASFGRCRYADGAGHPLWIHRRSFDDVLSLSGDKALWELLRSRPDAVTEVDLPGPAPRGVNTWDDYRALLDAEVTA